MVTVIAIILADLLLFVFYVCQYRQELGISVNGSHDMPVARKKPPRPPAAPSDATVRQTAGHRQIPTRGA